jgi:hypothetical protein
MTKVDIHFDLTRPLVDSDLDSIARVHGVFGIKSVKLKQPELDAVAVEYDASRLMEHDVEAALLRAGIPITRH